MNNLFFHSLYYVFFDAESESANLKQWFSNNRENVKKKKLQSPNEIKNILNYVKSS